MITKQYAQKNSRLPYTWLAFTACIAYAGAQNAVSAETPAIPESAAPAPVAAIAPAPIDNPIVALINGKQHPLLLRTDFSRDSNLLLQIYQSNNYQPIWLTTNRSEKNLNDLLNVLNSAPNDGLRSANYDADRLKQLIANPASPDAATTANHDVALTLSLVRYLHDLREGQIDPRDVQYPVQFTQKAPLDVPALLKEHLAAQTLPNLVSQFEPKSKQYQQLKQILNSQKQSPNNNQELGEFKLGKTLRPGEQHPQIDALRQRLQAMNVLSDSEKSEGKNYDNVLVAAVKKIQQQEGLKADGVIGPATAALFAPSSSEKTAQIELAMERARWLPDAANGPMILVNIPAFQLWAFNSPEDQNPLNMKVIVGKSPDNQTPALLEEMKYVEFMPYWNIPKSILEKEIWPKVANNEGYLASQEIELIRHHNSDEQGGGSYLRARQRPGKKNPLGRVKFVFPNKADVYLHDTPGKAAFGRQRRDLSHGCVRVSEPEKLAEFVLSEQEGWDKDSIKQAMSAPKTRHVTLKRSVPVVFYYATTFVDHANQLRFYPDVYGQDAQLQKALNKMQAPITANSSGNNIVASKSTQTN